MKMIEHNFYELIGFYPKNSLKNKMVEEVISPRKEDNKIINLYVDYDCIVTNKVSDPKFDKSSLMLVKQDKDIFCFRCKFFHSEFVQNRKMFSFIEIEKRKVLDYK